MGASASLRASLVPLLLLTGGTTSVCVITTDSSTGELHIFGTVRFLETGAGCWQVVATNGETYEIDASQAPASVLRDGARVALVVYVRETHRGECRVGTPVDVWRVVEVDNQSS
jgi:hypothetical protein